MTGNTAAEGETGNSDRLVQSWRANAKRWSSAVSEGKIASRKDATDAAIVSTVLRHQPKSILDLGCGEGWLCRALQPHVTHRVGIDASPELVEAARSGGGANFIELSYEALLANPTVAGIAFDSIVANFSLLDEKADKLIAALPVVVQPGGRLIIQTVHPLSTGEVYRTGWRTEQFKDFGSEDWVPMPWFFRTLENWISILGPAWKLEKLEEPRMAAGELPVSMIMTATKGGP
jgi:SAM-dependent methyltransferase